MTYAAEKQAMPTRTNMLHRRLMASAAVAASLTALALTPAAHAQGVAGTGVVNSGTANISSPNATTTQVTTTSQQTVITWSPTDTAPTGAPINFLPAGNNWTFIGTSPGYTVLNRFQTSGLPINRQIALNGTINSFLNVVGANVAGGNIWFYNAGGILIGSTGVINVGGLVLTANDIDTTGGLFSVGNNIRFRGAAGSTSTVQINAGASVTVANTNPGGAYMAIVAPRIVQRGLVSTDGSTAYVAAEQADIRINQGLFDINVLVGAEGGTVIDHTGTTTGPSAAQGDPDDSRIYMVAIPKNDAVTMLVSGQVGYQDPAVAQIDPNGAIRLSAGYDIFNGEIAQVPNPVSTAAADISVQDIIFNSDIVARASNNLLGAPVGTIPVSPGPQPQLGLLRFNGSALLQGDNLARLSVGNQQQIFGGGGLTLRSGGTAAQPGLAEILLTYNPAAPGLRPGLGVTGGALRVDAARGAIDSSGAASGGTARINNNGGLIVATDIILDADGIGEFVTATAGAGQGGTSELIVTGAGAVVQTVSLTLSAEGTGGGDRFNANLNITEVANTGGTGQGGTATATISNGAALTVLQAFAIRAAGSGGTGSDSAGFGTGGTARLSINGATSNVTTPSVIIDASGTGGRPVDTGPATVSNVSRGGDAVGGTAQIISGGIANLGAAFLDAGARGGAANSGSNTGGNAFGGNAGLTASGGTMTLSQLTLTASGVAGGGSQGLPASDVGGEGDGGNIAVRVNNAVVTISGDVIADAQANTSSGSADVTLARRGGDIEFRAENLGSISSSGNLTANASGGFDSGSGIATGTSQAAEGGTINLIGDNGALSFGSVRLNADGMTADGSISNGDATGGGIGLTASNNGVVETTDASGFNVISATGFAGSGPVGGQGTGGTVNLIADGGRVSLSNFTFVDVSGTSGTSNSATPSNPGVGGNILVRATAAGNSQLDLGTLSASATGRNGRLDEGGLQPGDLSAGDGIGGTILFEAFGGSITGDDVSIAADGQGGSSTNGAGGNGTGGNTTVTVGGGNVVIDSLTASANGFGGEGSENAVSGNGIGGDVAVNFDAGATTIGTVLAEAIGRGGRGSLGRDATATAGGIIDGGNAGDGIGGTVIVTVNGTDVNVGTLSLDASGAGGDGGDYDGINAVLGNTGSGGAGVGGDAALVYLSGTVLADAIRITAAGLGGEAGQLLLSSAGAGASDTSVGGAGGSGTGGSAALSFAADFDPGGIIELDASADGEDGADGFNAASGTGGNATGGAVFVTASGGNSTLDGIIMRADASAGDGGDGVVFNSPTILNSSAGGRGGDAVGGQVTVESLGSGTVLFVDNADLRVDAAGGDGGDAAGGTSLTGADGGAGTGGTFSFIASDGSEFTLTAPQALMATGRGGDGGNGAAGAAGSEFGAPAASGADGSAGIAAGAAGGNGGNGADGGSGGTGGTGGDGGFGGIGTGGTVNLIAQTSGLLTNQVNVFDVQGIGGGGGSGGRGGRGGDGQTGGSGGAGGNGGPAGPGIPAGAGGNGGNGGRGGDGGFGGTGGIGGIGGDGFGGTVLVSIIDGTINSGDLTINANGSGGETGGEGTGGAGGLAGEGGALGFGGLSATANGADGTPGTNGNGGGDGSPGSFNFGLARGGGGSITFATEGESGSINADFVRLISSAVDYFGNSFGSGGSIFFDVGSFTGSGTPITLAALAAESLGSDTTSGRFAIDIDAGQNRIDIIDTFELTATDGVRVAAGDGGQLTAGGSGFIISGTNVAFDMAGSGQFAMSGSLSVQAGEDILFTHVDSTAAPGVFANGPVNMFAGRDIIGDAGSKASGADNVELIAGGVVRLAGASAGGGLRITAGRVDVATLDAANAISVVANDTIVFGTANAGGNINITGSQINFTAIDGAGDVLMTTVAGTASAAGLPVGNGDIAGQSLSSDALARLNSRRNISIDQSSAFDIDYAAANNISGVQASAGRDLDLLADSDSDGSGNLTLTGDATAGVDATLYGANVALRDVVVNGANPAPPDRIPGYVTINSTNGNVVVNNVTAPGMTLVSEGGNISANDLRATYAGLGFGRPTVIDINAFGGGMTVRNLDSGGDVQAYSEGAINFTGTTIARTEIDVFSLSTISFGEFSSGDATTVDAVGAVVGRRIGAGGNATILSDSSITLLQGIQTPLPNTIGGNLVMTAPAMTFDPLQVAGNAVLNAVTDLNGQLSVGGTTNLDADSGLIQVTIQSGGPITASANSINLTATGSGTMRIAQLTTDVGGAVVNSGRDIIVQAATLAGNSSFNTTGGILTVDQATVSAGSLDLNADENITLGQISASNGLFIDSGERLSVNGVLSAPDIGARSGDIAIGANGRIGVLGTTQSLLVANNDSNVQTFVGGTGTPNGWHLDATEITRLFGNDIRISGIRVQTPVPPPAGSASPPDVLVDDFTINAAQQFGADGTFQIETRGNLRVLGDLRFTGVGDNQEVLVRGENALEIILGAGSIYLDGPTAGQLGGVLTLESDDIVIATAQAITDISALTDLTAIDARLAQNDGITNDIGALAANRINLNHNINTSVYIQNSGTGAAFDQRRGISFGAGGLFINGPGPLDNLVINAVQRTSAGVVTGLAVIPLVNINAPPSSPTAGPTVAVQLRVNPLSTINGCALGNVAACSAPPSRGPVSFFPVQDVIEDEIDDEKGREGEGDEGTGDSSVISPLITLRGLDPLTGEPLIDDPVTGAGNEDLWVPDE